MSAKSIISGFQRIFKRFIYAQRKLKICENQKAKKTDKNVNWNNKSNIKNNKL